MSKEVTVNFQLQYSDSNGSADSLQLANASYSVTSKIISRFTASAPTTAAALPLGSVASLGYIAIVNRDPTNFITLLTATSGVTFAKLWPGQGALFFFGSGVTAPFIKADTAVCQYDCLLLSV